MWVMRLLSWSMKLSRKMTPNERLEQLLSMRRFSMNIFLLVQCLLSVMFVSYCKADAFFERFDFQLWSVPVIKSHITSVEADGFEGEMASRVNGFEGEMASRLWPLYFHPAVSYVLQFQVSWCHPISVDINGGFTGFVAMGFFNLVQSGL